MTSDSIMSQAAWAMTWLETMQATFLQASQACEKALPYVKAIQEAAGLPLDPANVARMQEAQCKIGALLDLFYDDDFKGVEETADMLSGIVPLPDEA